MKKERETISTYLINHYEKVTKPQVVENSDIYAFLEHIKNPNKEFVETITYARKLLQNGNKSEYDKLKMQQPCCTLNFTFNEYKTNENIIGATGFMYIDIDESTEIDMSNPYLFATWKSFSKTGRGALVAIDGLTQENFQANYQYVARLLNIEADKNAAKATQYTIYSYDKNIYINENPMVINAIEYTNKSNTSKHKKLHNKLIDKRIKKDVSEMCKSKIKYNIYDELEFDGKAYMVFENEKEYYPELYIPKIIRVGQRNSILSAIAQQFRAINNNSSKEQFIGFMKFVNERCEEPLDEEELNSIINYKLKEDKPKLIYNRARRIIFDPYIQMDKKRKQKIVGRVIGQIRIKKTNDKIETALDNWSFQKNGKITQTSLSEVTGLHRNTIRKRIVPFSERIKKMNEEFKNN